MDNKPARLDATVKVVRFLVEAPDIEAQLRKLGAQADAHADEIRTLREKLGATTALYNPHGGSWSLSWGGAAPPGPGWLRAPKHHTRQTGHYVPDRKKAEGREILASVGCCPSPNEWRAVLGQESERIAGGVSVVADGSLRFYLNGSFDLEEVGPRLVVSMREHDGKLLGVAPAGCRKILESEYWQLKEWADGSLS